MQEIVNFYGAQLIVINSDKIKWVALKPICEAIGIDWPRQYTKIQNDPRFNCCHITTVGADGKNREMMCLPLDQINGWLFNINSNRVKSDCRETLLIFQRECQEALFRHFMPKGGTNEEFATTIENLEYKVNQLEIDNEDTKKQLNTVIQVLGPFLESSASAAGTILGAHKKTKKFRS